VRNIRALAILVALCGCEPDVPQRPVASALPKKVCDEAREAMTGATKTGGLILDSPVEGIIAHEAWLPMPEDHRDALTRTMGIAATCAEGIPRLEQEVVIRSETGMVLTRRVVQTSFSFPGS
jgi:hypothetical protein